MKPNKTYGQNFLKSPAVAERMVDAAEISSADLVLEAGPGKGALTEKLLARARQVFAVEKDERLVFYLTLKFKEEFKQNKLVIVGADILKFDPTEVGLQTGGYKIVANIPYYITGEFLRHFLSEVAQPSKMVIMVQKEVAERILAKDPRATNALGLKESILSISIKAYAEPKYLETVPAELFTPKPKVDSAVIVIDKISRDFFTDVSEKRFFNIVKRGFAHKRKLLVNNLEIITAAGKKVLADCGIAPNARAENLTLRQWKHLAENL
ncbi:MAG: ribosomal RNA small subunit methyltransferase A [Candidatus Taylorbacteria bacterium RIFCSPHIGHO2_02_FULL_44_36]|uniref:Ribosomal RNA small subunit methyltransferase A n=1 Tax=Candidatus Taylorbacteria bacterium RIFCSPLOWO2_12_FULL_44_15c TaxID=1802333 RepID=A0A1G2P4T6_9BACT|nr:MAG: ribosomal RNA small subunit methyltransferase A [Candidatus Taylorbacteria bacterium RIFCSPHIGHO2_02_FULL_44_36]OHA39175.1 MAG: ribosomal RNA small subunit methyltransferase A [Candidatus Taylorbacteria bacterium RIFCSPLOWO2_02_FULL_44_35]OHA43377.1 MAG: ribosomal RNA small subunit methyltransferase A [Candidatus Taylorbacteria bacterium RIFCSPLOWO2_12_FULL_44_15c]